MIHIYFVLAKASQVGGDLDKDVNAINTQENQLQQLYAEFDLLKSDLALRMELTSELQAEVQNWENKFQRVEEEKLSAIQKLSNALENCKVVTDQVRGKSCVSPTIAPPGQRYNSHREHEHGVFVVSQLW